jgi:DNA replication and repair protein RecF
MKCNGISVGNFRNISNTEVAFTPGVNVLYGENAQGKTSLLEAIYLVSLGRSFRSAHEADLIKFGEDYARISLDFADSLRNQNITIFLSRDKRRQVEQNRVKVTKMSDIIGQFRAVMFCPEHLSLVKDGPAERRAYLDVAISQLRPVYLKSLQRYSQILRQRNQLIKSAYHDRKAFDDTIEFWSAQLAHEAAVISKFRLWYSKLADEHVKRFFLRMTGEREIPEIVYLGSSKQEPDSYLDTDFTEKRYFELLMSAHDREIAQGATLFGVHKDDLEINLNGKSARIYGSQGQQRSLSITMKLAEGEICRTDCGEFPVFLLDDVLSELDGRRRAFLQSEMQERQVIMTTCEPIEKSPSVNVITVKNGEFFG